MNHLNDIICEGINGKCIKPGICCNHISCVSVDDIRDSVMSLKADKRDCTANLYTDHLMVTVVYLHFYLYYITVRGLTRGRMLISEFCTA